MDNNSEPKKQGLIEWIKSRSYNVKFVLLYVTIIAVIGIAVLVLALTLGMDMNWYGFIIACAIILCVVFGQFAATKQGYYGDLIIDYVIFAVPLAFLGGLFYYAASKNWAWGGIAVLGALIGAGVGLVIALFVYRKLLKNKPKVTILQLLDLCAPFFLMGQAIGRYGCIFAGCCYGIEVPEGSFMSYLVYGETHLMNPMIESIWCWIGFIPLVIMYFSRRKSFNGFYISLYCIWYGIERFILEFFRDPAEKLTAGSSSFGTSQIVSLAMIAFGIFWIVFHIIRAKRSGKKIMIMVPKEKLSSDYYGYENTIYANPHIDENRKLIKRETADTKTADTDKEE